jgi:transcriptional regulator with XRE-family HTH domain
MNDLRLGAALRAVRVRRHLRQQDVAAAARVSHATVSRLERGRVGSVDLGRLRAVAAVLQVQIDVVARWQGRGDLEQLLDAAHAELQERLARILDGLAGWTYLPEVSFSIYGERGSIDLLAWHAASRSLLVIEIKTRLVDMQDLLATVDRKKRLARSVAADRGWDARHVSTWVVLADTTTNRRRVAEHASVLRAAFPLAAAAMRRWLSEPRGSVGALSFLPMRNAVSSKRSAPGARRVRSGRGPRT